MAMHKPAHCKEVGAAAEVCVRAVAAAAASARRQASHATEWHSTYGAIIVGMKPPKMGSCALCLNFRPLELSHFLPQGVSKRLRSPRGPVTEPILVTRQVSISTSNQLRDHLLCSSCEKLFDQRGEDYALRQMNNRGRFPLLDRLRVSPCLDFSLREGVYSGSALGIDTEKLAYFALSVVWRGAVHTWRAADGQNVRPINLGPCQETIRQHLLGRAPFPSQVAVVVNVCTDFESQVIAYYPTPRLGIPGMAYAFLACGIHFTVFTEATDPSVRRVCCVGSAEKLIFSRNIKALTYRAYGKLAATSRPVGALAGQ